MGTGSSGQNNFFREQSYQERNIIRGEEEGMYYGDLYLVGTLITKTITNRVHHFFQVKVHGYNIWIVYEWCENEGGFYGDNFHAYIKKHTTHVHSFLGEFPIKDVYNACMDASSGKTFGYTYNCNHWSEKVIKYLMGKNVDIGRNCDCVDYYSNTISEHEEKDIY